MCWLIIMSGVSLGMKRKKMCRQMTHLFSLRKERDSNPRYGYPYNGFRDRPDRPLRHLSFFDFLTVQRYCFFRQQLYFINKNMP